jgi:hypothetical protein
MTKHQFTLTIKGTEMEATQKAKAVSILANNLTSETLVALAEVVLKEPQKVQLAKQFLGIKD